MTPPIFNLNFHQLSQAASEVLDVAEQLITQGELPSCPESGPTLCRVSDAMARQASRPLRADLPPNPGLAARRFLERAAPFTESLLMDRSILCPQGSLTWRDAALALGVTLLTGSALPVISLWPMRDLAQNYCAASDTGSPFSADHQNHGSVIEPDRQVRFFRQVRRLGSSQAQGQTPATPQREVLECRMPENNGD